MQDNDKQELNDTENSPERYTDKVTKSKIHKHLTDINDTISAQDIKNIDANISSRDVQQADNQKTEELHPDNPDKDDSDEDNREQLPTTWNILD